MWPLVQTSNRLNVMMGLRRARWAASKNKKIPRHFIFPIRHLTSQRHVTLGSYPSVSKAEERFERKSLDWQISSRELPIVEDKRKRSNF